MTKNFSSVTELPGSPATVEQKARLLHRYHVARECAAGKRVLEISCGAGIGLGYVAEAANRLFAGDLTLALLQKAKAHYGRRVPLVLFDAQKLPFRDGSFDLVYAFECIYYFPDAGLFIEDGRRVLVDGGKLLIGTVNREWNGFSDSRLSTTFYSLGELSELVSAKGFTDLAASAAFSTQVSSLKGRAISLLRRAAARLHLVPRTLEGRRLLKRLFYGGLSPLPAELKVDGANPEPTISVRSPRGLKDFKILYLLASRKRSGL